MRTIRRLGRYLSVLGVLVVAVVAGLFLAACAKVSPPKRPGPAKERTTSKPAASTTRPGATTTRPAGTTKPAKSAVDVKETEQGQPVPRNLLE